MKGLYLHTRDLRHEDNPLLNKAIEENTATCQIFIMNKQQVDKENTYRSSASILFMIECLQELAVPVYYGDLYEVLKLIFENNKIDNFYISTDYSPFAKEREEKLAKLCKIHNVKFITEESYLLVPSEHALKDDMTCYKKFTPFYNKAKEYCVPLPSTIPIKKSFKLKGVKKINLKKYKETFSEKTGRLKGGRTEALAILNRIIEYKNYGESRDDMGLERSVGTTGLSPYMKFNVVSPREVYEKVKKIEALCRQLYWRDFYMMTMKFYGTAEIIRKTEMIKWDNNSEQIKAFCEGRTGIPLIDASIREMLSTGSMHNRGRMNVSNFLIKILRVDWRIGEKFFSQHLTDIDYCNNFGGWTWSSGLGYDSQPYFRIFNPYRQAENHDPTCQYILRWIPELKSVPIKDILNWEKKHSEYKVYHAPIVTNLSAEGKKTIELYKSIV